MIGLYLYILIFYVKLATIFCTATEKVKDVVNNTMDSIKKVPTHPLGKLEETAPAGDNVDTSQI